MTWQLLEEYDELISGLSKRDPFYSEKSFHILESLRDRNNLDTYEFTKFFNVIITRNKFKNKEIINDDVRNLNSILKDESYDDISEFKEVYYECLDVGSTARVTGYIESNLRSNNYHYELCRRCNPNADTSSLHFNVQEACQKSLKAMFCLYSMMADHKRYGFLCVTTESAFLPAKGSHHKCTSSEVSPNMIFQKVKHILTTKFGYSVVDGTPLLFSHDQYGLALVSKWEILFYSSAMNEVRSLLSDHFLWAYLTNHFTFMGYHINMNKQMLTTNWYDFVQDKLPEYFTDVGLNYIHAGASYPTNGYFEYLETPPYGEPSHIDQGYILHNIMSGGLTFPSEFSITENELQGCRSMIGVLNYVASNFRWDLKYYVSVLSRYANTPNGILYMAIMDIFRYIYSTRNFLTMYKHLPKNLPMIVNIFADGHFNDNNPNCSYSGFLINIGKRYWHSQSKRIKINVDEEFVSALSTAHDAVQYMVLNKSILQTLANQSNKKIKYYLNIENQFLFDVLIEGADCVLSASWRKRLDALNKWVEEYEMYVCVIDDSENPAAVLTRNSTAARDYLFEQSQYVNYAYEGYEDPLEEYEGSEDECGDAGDAYHNYSGNMGWESSENSYW